MKLPQSIWDSRIGLCIRTLLLVVAALVVVSPATAAEDSRRIYLLQGLTATQPGADLTVAAFRSRLQQQSSEPIEVFTDIRRRGRERHSVFALFELPLRVSSFAHLQEDECDDERLRRERQNGRHHQVTILLP